MHIKYKFLPTKSSRPHTKTVAEFGQNVLLMVVIKKKLYYFWLTNVLLIREWWWSYIIHRMVSCNQSLRIIHFPANSLMLTINLSSGIHSQAIFSEICYWPYSYTTPSPERTMVDTPKIRHEDKNQYLLF